MLYTISDTNDFIANAVNIKMGPLPYEYGFSLYDRPHWSMSRIEGSSQILVKFPYVSRARVERVRLLGLS